MLSLPPGITTGSIIYLSSQNGCDTQDSPCQPLIVMCMREKSIFLSHYHWGLFVTRLWCKLFETSQAQLRELQYQGIWICLLIPKRLWMFKPQGGQRCIWTSGRAGTKNWVLQSSLSLLFLVCLALFSPITMLPSLHGEREQLQQPEFSNSQLQWTGEKWLILSLISNSKILGNVSNWPTLSNL